MKRIPVTNNTAMPIYVGAAMIPAGETRIFNEDEVPPHLRSQPEPAAAPAPAVDPAEAAKKAAEEAEAALLAGIVAGNAKGAIEALGKLTDEQLARLEKLEQERAIDGQPAARKTVLEAISEEMLKRAAEGGGQANG